MLTEPALNIWAGVREDAIAYFQSLWSDEFYNLWLEGGGLKKKSER